MFAVAVVVVLALMMIFIVVMIVFSAPVTVSMRFVMFMMGAAAATGLLHVNMPVNLVMHSGEIMT